MAATQKFAPLESATWATLASPKPCSTQREPTGSQLRILSCPAVASATERKPAPTLTVGSSIGRPRLTWYGVRSHWPKRNWSARNTLTRYCSLRASRYQIAKNPSPVRTRRVPGTADHSWVSCWPDQLPFQEYTPVVTRPVVEFSQVTTVYVGPCQTRGVQPVPGLVMGTRNVVLGSSVAL